MANRTSRGNLARAIVAATGKPEIYEATVRLVCDRLPADTCKIATIEADEVVIEAETSNGVDSPGRRILLTEWELSAAITRGKAEILDDLAASRSNCETSAATNPDYRAMAVAPIDDAGVILAAATDPGAFTDAHLQIIETIAQFTGAALEQTGSADTGPRNGALLEEVASILSHDLQSPLAIASGNLELVREESDAEQLATIAAALDRLEAMLDDVVTLARTGERVDPSETVTLDAIAETAWAMVETGAADLTVEDSATFRADRSRLQQVFENLFSNAVNHAGPTVSITVGLLDDTGGIYVEDDGPGVPQDRRDEVFEFGYSSTHQQRGFGLAIVRRIVEAHGWTIRVTEGASGGARFEIARIAFEN